MNATLTKIQQRILQFIADFSKDEGRSPTGTEVQQHFNYSHHSTARQHLQALARKNFIELARGGYGVPYHIKLKELAYSFIETPRLAVLGTIMAGSPDLAVEEPDAWVERLDDLLPARPGDFLLKVKGDSMIGEGILPGDLVLVHPQPEVTSGAIAAVLVSNSEATLKRVYPHTNAQVRLVAANPTIGDMIFPADDVNIIGAYVGLVRTQPGRARPL